VANRILLNTGKTARVLTTRLTMEIPLARFSCRQESFTAHLLFFDPLAPDIWGSREL
jgi:hypothetical protein